jgi:phage terminase large subunit GpA-like protein
MNPSTTLQTATQVSQFIGTIVADALRPDPVLSVWEWADEFRRLSQKSSAQTGKYRTSKTPYWREVMECLSAHSPVRRVVVRKPAQVGFTEVLNNWTGYIIDHAPGPTLLVQPTVDMCKRYSKQRIAPMIEDTPVLRAKVTEMKSRDSGNTILEKDFAGGVLVMAGANSSTGLRGRLPARCRRGRRPN